ncbi:MAG: hypothetical protein U0263_22125 [Polyangiaceae bacterium]
MKQALLFTFGLALAGCHSPGQYGYARVYSPLSDEETAQKGAKEFDPVMVQRAPDEWRGKAVTLFGVVKARNPGPGGNADLTLSVRSLEPRNLCDTGDEDTCRVTVGDREHAIVHALSKLSGDDDIGKLSVGAGSLVRIVGTLSDNVDPDDGAQVVRVTYLRHWPRDYYVTTADRSHMRR